MDRDPNRWDNEAAARERHDASWDAGSHSHRVLKVVCLGLVVLALIGWQALHSIQVSPTIAAVAPQVRLAAKSVVLTPSAAVLSGHIRVTYDTMSDIYAGLAVGMSIGLPEYDAQPPTAGASTGPTLNPSASTPAGSAAATPRVLFTDPLVRMSAVGRSGDTTCAGPCEIGLNLDDCQNACSMDFHFSLALVPSGDARAVHAKVTAAASVQPGKTLPGGLAVEMTFDPTPVGSGG